MVRDFFSLQVRIPWETECHCLVFAGRQSSRDLVGIKWNDSLSCLQQRTQKKTCVTKLDRSEYVKFVSLCSTWSIQSPFLLLHPLTIQTFCKIPTFFLPFTQIIWPIEIISMLGYNAIPFSDQTHMTSRPSCFRLPGKAWPSSPLRTFTSFVSHGYAAGFTITTTPSAFSAVPHLFVRIQLSLIVSTCLQLFSSVIHRYFFFLERASCVLSLHLNARLALRNAESNLRLSKTSKVFDVRET